MHSSRAMYFVGDGKGKGTPKKKGSYKTFILDDAVFDVESRYKIKELIGHGAYGVVSSARDLKTDQAVAVKKIENIFEHRSLAKRTLRELKILRFFDHENIIGLERVMRPKSSRFNDVYLVSELMETDLACVIRSPQALTDEHQQFFMYQLLRGLKYIHSADVVHRDLKPRNLLVNANCDLKICDFGLARVDDPKHADRCQMSDYVATRWYRSPEVILGEERYTKAIDIWSAGCILAELIGRKPLFPGKDSFHQLTLIISVLGSPDPSKFSNPQARDLLKRLAKQPKISFAKLFPEASSDACDLLDKLLAFNPMERISVIQALKHPYFADLHDEEDEPECMDFNYEEFYFEYLPNTKDDLRTLVANEVFNNYAVEEYESTNDADTGSVLLLNHNPPKSGRRLARRKSF